jgi:hypothetical protein
MWLRPGIHTPTIGSIATPLQRNTQQPMLAYLISNKSQVLGIYNDSKKLQVATKNLPRNKTQQVRIAYRSLRTTSCKWLVLAPQVLDTTHC